MHLGGKTHQVFIKSLAVEQAGQCIALAVVQQALVVLVDRKNGQNDIQLMLAGRGGANDFDAGMHLLMHPDWQPQYVLPMNARLLGLLGTLRDTCVQMGTDCSGLRAGSFMKSCAAVTSWSFCSQVRGRTQ